jgi:hypothetical protein
VGGVADRGDVGELVEQLEVRDDAIADRRAVGRGGRQNQSMNAAREPPTLIGDGTAAEVTSLD